MSKKINSPRFTLRRASEALQEQPPIEWLVDGLLTAGSVNIVSGAAGSKKTYAMLDLAVCIAAGKEWLGEKKTKQGAVLIVDEESGTKRLMRRLAQVQRGHLIEHDKIDLPLFFVSLAAFNVGLADDITALQLLVQEHDIQLVIIDALVDVMPGKDENKASDTQAIFQQLRILSDLYNVAFIVIHHLNKQGGTRGSTAIPGGVDLVLNVESKASSKTIKFQTEKARDIEGMEFYAAATFAGDEQEPDQFSLSARDEPTQEQDGKIKLRAGEEQVLLYLDNKGRSSTSEIVDAIGSNSTARKSIMKLTHCALIKRVDGGGPGEPAEYDLTPKGKEQVTKI